MLERDRLLTVFSPDLLNGRLYWRRPSKYHAEKTGTEAGCSRYSRHGKHYWIIKLDGRARHRSHLIYCIVHGRFPEPCADHINGDSLDDRPCNLREATVTQNAWNHKTRKRRISLPMGVRVSAASGRYVARISCHGRQIHLGAYDTPEEAQQVYLAKRKELFGEFA